MPSPVPSNESARLEALYKRNILDSETEPRFDKLTEEATEKLHAPISTITIIDKDREWFKSCRGLDMKEGPRSIAFCSYALLAKDVFIVEDTLKDDRFRTNPYVTGPQHIRFYAGIALRDYQTGHPIGVLCIKDRVPRKLSVKEIGILLDIANRAEQELNR